jgi:hypothetical protein
LIAAAERVTPEIRALRQLRDITQTSVIHCTYACVVRGL